MNLCRITGEFISEDMAELAAGRIRRNIKGIRRIAIRNLGKARPSVSGKQHFTMLPANLRMENYATDVLFSEMSHTIYPEHDYRKTAELTIICDKNAAGSVSAVMQALGAMHVHKF